MKNKNTIILIVGVVVLIVFWFIGKYNGLVNKEENVNSKWAQVENVYQRRADLIPNLDKAPDSWSCAAWNALMFSSFLIAQLVKNPPAMQETLV